MSIIDQKRFADNFPKMDRKCEFGEQTSTDYNSLTDEQKAIIAELIPHITYLDSEVSAFQDVFTDNKDQFHIVKHVDRYYLVDTQGYDYCRCTIYLENFDPSKKVEKTEKQQN